jgi:tRNA wybutosine-synthesizing protein 3
VESNLITKGGKWLLSEHASITLDLLKQALNTEDARQSNMIIFKHEPFIMHVVCRDIEAAKEMSQWGLSCGFRESGVVIGNKKVQCHIRTTANTLEIPLARNGQLFVDEAYLKWIVEVANDKFRANKRRTDQLLDAFKAKFCIISKPPIATSPPPMFKYDLLDVELQRVGHSAVIYGDEIVVFGGQGLVENGKTSRLADVQIFSIGNDGTSLSLIKNITSNQNNASVAPSARCYHTATVYKNKMYVYGGRTSPINAFDDLYIFDLKTHEWNLAEFDSASAAPVGRWSHSATLLGSNLYIYGGRNETKVLNDLYALDLEAKPLRWKNVSVNTNVCKPKFDHVAVAIASTKKLLFFGGMISLTGKEDKPDYLCVFDTMTNEWKQQVWKRDTSLETEVQTARELPLGLLGADATVVNDQYVLLVGGINSNSSESQQYTSQAICCLNTTNFKMYCVGFVDGKKAAFVHHCAIWSNKNQRLLILGGGFQCFGFGFVYSHPFSVQVPLENSSSSSIKASAKYKNVIPNATKTWDIRLNNPLAVAVDKANVKAIKTLLEKVHVYDKARRVHVAPSIQLPNGNNAYLLPVIPGIYDAIAENSALQNHLSQEDVVPDEDSYANKFGKTSGFNRSEVIKSIIKRVAQSHGISVDLISRIPDKFEYLSDVLMIPRDAFLESEWQPLMTEIWRQVCETKGLQLMPTRVARKAYIDSGEKRQSHVELLYTSPQMIPTRSKGWVEIRENGIIYGFDMTRVMFSSGNVTEKARMAKIGCKGETIVDLFCGIGYYALPFLIHGDAAFVHAHEWNPDSVDALKWNLERNHVSHKCQVHFGDNQKSAPTLGSIADRVNLGLLPTSEKAWPLAVQVMKPEGGWMHVHDNVAVEDRESWELHVVNSMQKLAQQYGKKWKIECAHVEKVKSYAPKVYHYVADIHCKQINQ